MRINEVECTTDNSVIREQEISIIDMMRSIEKLESDLKLKAQTMTRQDYYREKNRIGELRKKLKKLIAQHQNTP